MDYSNEKKKVWRKLIKERAIEALGGKCACCNQQFESCCYDFHHIDCNEKDFELSSIQYNGAKSWYKIRDELLKCALVCANCHRLVHGNYIKIEKKQYFLSEYYEWELAEFKQIDSVTLLPRDIPSEKYVCPKCGNTKTPSAKVCFNCRKTEESHFNISRDELKMLIRTKSFTQIGKMFTVSDNAIRHRCETFNLPSRKTDINKITDDEWSKI